METPDDICGLCYHPKDSADTCNRHDCECRVDRLVNLLVGKRFDRDGKKYVITWNDNIHLRATPVDCKTGLTSIEFRVDDIGLVNMREG